VFAVGAETTRVAPGMKPGEVAMVGSTVQVDPRLIPG